MNIGPNLRALLEAAGVPLLTLDRALRDRELTQRSLSMAQVISHMAVFFGREG